MCIIYRGLYENIKFYRGAYAPIILEGEENVKILENKASLNCRKKKYEKRNFMGASVKFGVS